MERGFQIKDRTSLDSTWWKELHAERCGGTWTIPIRQIFAQWLKSRRERTTQPCGQVSESCDATGSCGCLPAQRRPRSSGGILHSRATCDILKSQGVPEVEGTRILRLLSSRRYPELAKGSAALWKSKMNSSSMKRFEEKKLIKRLQLFSQKMSKVKQQSWIRNQSERHIVPIFNRVSMFPWREKKRFELFTGLGQCCMIPNMDFMRWEYRTSSTPATSSFETVCKLCAKSKGFEQKSSTNTSFHGPLTSPRCLVLLSVLLAHMCRTFMSVSLSLKFARLAPFSRQVNLSFLSGWAVRTTLLFYFWSGGDARTELKHLWRGATRTRWLCGADLLPSCQDGRPPETASRQGTSQVAVMMWSHLCMQLPNAVLDLEVHLLADLQGLGVAAIRFVITHQLHSVHDSSFSSRLQFPRGSSDAVEQQTISRILFWNSANASRKNNSVWRSNHSDLRFVFDSKENPLVPLRLDLDLSLGLLQVKYLFQTKARIDVAFSNNRRLCDSLSFHRFHGEIC